jgi:hypothetical protein
MNPYEIDLSFRLPGAVTFGKSWCPPHFSYRPWRRKTSYLFFFFLMRKSRKKCCLFVWAPLKKSWYLCLNFKVHVLRN